MRRRITVALAAAALGIAGSGSTHAGELSEYTVKQLLEPCVEGDNDSRWGAAAEAECEQYIMGFTDAFVLTATPGAYCLPEQNRSDEVRWAFMRWVHGNYSARTKMLAAEAVMETLKASFPCS